MSKRVNDADALFRSFGASADDFRELKRDSDVAEAVNRWPLIKSMPIDKHVLPAALSTRQKRAWLNAAESFERSDNLKSIFDRTAARPGHTGT